MRKMKTYCVIVIIATFIGSVIAFPQNNFGLPNALPSGLNGDFYQVDGFIFDGPADPPTNKSRQKQPTTASNVVTLVPTATTSTTTTTTTTPGPQNANFDMCVNSCLATQEYNPVCGTDRVSYDNPGRLGCATRCGKVVRLDYYGRCAPGITKG